ncbi:MAG: hypothetical protein MUO34_12640, partial [Ignavibacteriaceae bacterium]|nr:hypothetical protein [Ignavibacteriaceae bacterium]
MKKLKIFIVLSFLLVTLTGCLQVDTTITLNPDGSGVIEETVLMKSTIIEMIREFASSFDENAEEDEFKFYKVEEQKNKASDYGEGVTFLEGTEIIEEDWEGYKVKYSFKDINKLKIDPSPDDKINIGDEEEDTDQAEREYITFNFEKGNPSDLKIIFPKPEFKEDKSTETVEADSVDTGAAEMFKNMFEGMRVSVNLKLNGNITETNASFVNGNTITMMEIDFANILNNEDIITSMEKKNPQSLEEFRELTKDIEGIKIEFQEEVNVKFR